jgi:DNA-binding protein Alba
MATPHGSKRARDRTEGDEEDTKPSSAVDVAEITRHQFLKNVEIDRIEIGSEDTPVREENRTRTVSTIEMTLKRSN